MGVRDMWVSRHTKVYQDVKKETLWRLWLDVNNWTAWHGDLDYCRLEETFAVGSYFQLKPRGAPPVKIRITKVEDGTGFTDCTSFPGAKMYDTHEMEETPDGVRLTNILTVGGPLAFVWIKLVAENVARTVPEENDALVRLARSVNE
jgi:hypothetical protein